MKSHNLRPIITCGWLCVAALGARLQAVQAADPVRWVTTATHAHRIGTALAAGPVAADDTLNIVVALKLRNRAELDARVAEMTDPSSPSFRRYAAHEELFERYAPSAAQAQSVADYLTRAGFTRVNVERGNLLVSARGTAANVQRAFNTPLAHFTRDGRRAIVNTADAKVPGELADTIAAVLGLQTLDQYHLATNVIPTEFPVIYDASSLPPATSTTVGIIAAGSQAEATQTVTDLTAVLTDSGAPALPVNVVLTGNGYGQGSGGVPEWDLDSQNILGMAGQLGRMIFYWASDLSDSSMTLAINEAVNDNVAKVINESFGECEEAAYIDGAMTSNDGLYELAVAQGQTVSVAAGDYGAYACGSLPEHSGAYGTSLGVQYAASSPYVIAVGGTTLSLAGSETYGSETAWSYGGGGPSAYETQPSWQAGVVPGTMRGVPDIALDAAGTYSSVLVNLKYSDLGGTSLASPLFVGAWARLESAHANGLGFPAPWLYGIGTTTGVSVFNDITSGSNGGYSAGPGWDYVTGFGSPNFANLNTYLSAGLLATNVDQEGGRLYLFYRAQDMNLYQATAPWPSTASLTTQVLSSGKTAPPVAPQSGIAAYDNTIYGSPEVFYLATTSYGDHVEQLWGTQHYPTDLNIAISSSNPPTAALSGSRLVGFIDSCAGSDNEFYVDANHHVRLLTWTPNGNWSSGDLTSITQTGAVAGTQLIGHIKGDAEELFYVESDNRVHELWRWSGCANAAGFDGWHSTVVNLANGNDAPNVAAGSPLAAIYDSTAATDSVFYIDVQGYLRELFFSTQGIWSNINVTGIAAAVSPGSGSTLSAHLDTIGGAREEVFFLDASGNVRLVSAPSSNPTQWTGPASALNTQAGTCAGNQLAAPAAATGSPLASDANTVAGEDELYYVSAAGQPYALWSAGGVWQCTAVTQSSPAAAQ
jgi:pseudomonalisin